AVGREDGDFGLGSTASFTTTPVKLTRVPLGPVASATTSGAVTTGGVVSRTVTLNVAVATLPAASRAVTVTGVVPRANTDPLGRGTGLPALPEAGGLAGGQTPARAK